MSALHSAEIHYSDHPDLIHRTPWWTISVVFHVIVVLMAMMLMVTEMAPDKEDHVLIIEPLSPITKVFEKTRTVIPHDFNSMVTPDTVITPEPAVVPEPIPIPALQTIHPDNDTKSARGNDGLTMVDLKNNGTFKNFGVGGGGAGAFGRPDGGGLEYVVGQQGGGRETHEGVGGALEWFKRHQAPDGSWSFDGYHHECKEVPACDHRDLEKSYPEWDSCATGFALLCFLGYGNTQTNGVYRTQVVNGLTYLLENQKEDGSFSSNNYVHAISSMALIEAYGMSRSEELREPSQKAVNVILSRQNDGGYLGWDYGKPTMRNDTSVTGWQVMALKSAKMSDLEIGGAFEGVRNFLSKITPKVEGDEYNPIIENVAYSFWQGQNKPGHRNATLTAIGLLSRIFLGENTSKPMLKAHANKLLNHLPETGKSDYYQWYYATLAMFQMGGEHWKKYNKAMKDALVSMQNTEGCAEGSWDAPENSSCHGTRRGGRLFATAAACLSLEVYVRYQRLSGR